MSQVGLAGGDFSKGFISLVETGRSRASMRAVEIFAARLDVTVAELLDYEAPKPLDDIGDLARRLAIIARHISNPTQQLVLRALAEDAARLAARRVVAVDAVHQRVARALEPLRELEKATS